MGDFFAPAEVLTESFISHQSLVTSHESQFTILSRTRYNPRVQQRLEYAALWLLLKIIGALPRPLARLVGARTAAFLFLLRPGLRAAATENLRLAFPEWNKKQQRAALRGMVRQLGWMGAEFAHFPHYHKNNIERTVLIEGFENFASAQARGKGVLFLTGHMSAWEIAPFAQALYGNPLHFLVRPIDNPLVDELIMKYRCSHGNQPIDKNQSARAVLKVLATKGTVGILADQNTQPAEGVFVDFFGIPACTTAGIARFALHTDAAVVPGFIHWDSATRKYRLRFEPEVKLIRTGDDLADIRENTQSFTRVIENYVRRYPDQWLWVHRRWKTRPAGEPSVYK
ncbi:MAG TPA: lysophospholipid acyltransferase family protein [Candidatus Acidoferrales bacterium]|jgi:KDO2-lipid IV(A) lauroyltransferase|nr:lysophospholipid acyltransferase family protein [Candidatus Acidoferrales bacterium]